MVIIVSLCNVAILESKETKKLSSLPLTLSFITVESEITNGLALKL